MNKRWMILDQTIKELQMMEKINEVPLNNYNQKLNRLKKLNKLVLNDEEQLKEKILSIVHERNVYAQKINAIWQLGQIKRWKDDKNILSKVRAQIELKNNLLKKQL